MTWGFVASFGGIVFVISALLIAERLILRSSRLRPRPRRAASLG